MKSVLVLSLGGTIDSAPYPEDENLYPVNSSPNEDNGGFQVLNAIVNKRDLPIALKQIRISNKDSKDINEQDIAKLAKNISNEKADRIIVTMGTDRMCETARAIAEKVKTPACPIVFTGAIWPLANGLEKSDGYQNLENALLGRLGSKAGIYIAMNGLFDSADKIRKDFSLRKFIKKDKN